jgi:hypothetical protein
VLVTSGDGARGIPASKIKISLSRFIEAFRIAAMGYSIKDGKLVVEPVTSFFPDGTAAGGVIHLGDAKELKVSVYKDGLFSSLQIGYNNREINGVNGKYRFNNLHEYSTPTTRSGNKLNLVSPAIADPYVIEYDRMRNYNKKTTDSSNDNDIVFFHAEPNTVTNLATVAAMEQKTIVSGSYLPYTTYDNIGLTANSALDRFTWFGPPTGVTFTIIVNPVATQPLGDDVTALLYINGLAVAQATIPADGTTAIFFQHIRTLQTNDVVAVMVTSLAGFNVNVISATLECRFSSIDIYRLFRETYDSLTGVRDDTVYNIELLTPKRMLKLWKPYLVSFQYRNEGKEFIFQTSDRNPDLRTVKGAVTVDEDANEPIEGSRLFKPYVFEFETEVPVDLVDLVDAYPNNLYSFAYDGIVYEGYLLKAGIAPDDNRSQVFQLLCGPNTDETKLINR